MGTKSVYTKLWIASRSSKLLENSGQPHLPFVNSNCPIAYAKLSPSGQENLDDSIYKYSIGYKYIENKSPDKMLNRTHKLLSYFISNILNFYNISTSKFIFTLFNF